MKSKPTSIRKRPPAAPHRASKNAVPEDDKSKIRLRTRQWLPPWLVASTCVILVAVISYAVFHFVILTRLPHAMLGKWLVVGKEMNGARLEFFRDGAMIGTVNMEGKEGKIKGRVKVAGKTMWITTINPMTKEPHTDVQTIRTLTANEFIIEDRKGTVLKMERLRE